MSDKQEKEKPSRPKGAKPSKPAASRPASTAGLDLLLALVFLTVLVAYASVLAVKVSNAPVLPWAHVAPLGLFALSLALVRLVLGLSGYRGDAAIVAGAMLLAGLGMVVQLRVGTYAGGLLDLAPFALGVCVFLLALVLAGKGRAGQWGVLGWPAYLGALAVLTVVIAFGQRFRGGLFLPGNYNPTELAKPLLVLFLAMFLCGRKTEFSATQAGLPAPPWPTLLGLGVLWGVPLVLFVLMGDLGQAMLMGCVLVSMLYAATRKPGWLVAGVVVMVALGMLGGYLSAHAQVRIAIWRDPFVDPTGRGWQVLQGLSALYAGGMWGCGFGSGAPGAVPIVSSDFIYAALGEEIGWAGCALVLATVGVLCGRAWRAAASAAAPLAMVFGAGLSACLAIQTLLNVAGVTKALPLTGITLPFISHGGSSLFTSFLIAGLLAAISEKK
ncbi:MAG: FtsW/RodA/SpoVE family cell cycle protein [bacterium]